MRAIIITVAVTVLLLLALETALLEAYRFGRRRSEQEHADERTQLQQVIDEYRMKLADVRIREKLAKEEANDEH